MDSVRADFLSCYGYERSITPNLDSIANDSLVFRNAYSTGNWTVPAHASLFTGYYPSEHGTHAQNHFLNPSLPTLGERLREDGYTTIGCSCNPFITGHFGYTRGFKKFQEFIRARGNENNVIDWSKFVSGVQDTHGLARYQKIIKYLLKNRDKNLWRSIKEGLKLKFQRGSGAEKINQYVRLLKSKGELKSPFFFFANYMETHVPYKPPWKYLNFLSWPRYLKKILWPSDINIWEHYLSKRNISAGEISILQWLYRGALKYLDVKIGELYRELKDDNTVFIILSDHGENLGDHGLLQHNLRLNQALIRIPLLIHNDRSGSVYAVCDLVDVHQTVLNIANIPTKKTWRSRDLISRSSESGFALAEYLGLYNYKQLAKKFGKETIDERWNSKYRSLIKDGYKYIRNLTTSQEIAYDLEKDPEEMDLLNDPGTLRYLRNEMETLVKQFKVHENPGNFKKPQEKVRDRLRDLGYL